VVCKEAGEHTFTLAASGNGNTHEDQAVLEVMNYGEPVKDVRCGLIHGDESKPKWYYLLNFEFPKEADYNSRQIVYEYFPTAFHYMLNALGYLKPGKNPNLELLINSFLPHWEIVGLLKDEALKDSLLRETVESASQAVITLSEWQNTDGGWGWWPSEETDPEMTSLALQGLSVAREILKDVWGTQQETMLQKGIQAGYTLLEHKGLDLSTKTYLAYGLCHSGKYQGMGETVKEIFKYYRSLSSYGLALLLESLHRLNRQHESEKVLKLLEDRALEITGEVSWASDLHDAWFNQPVEATAQVLKSLSDWYPKHRLLNKVFPYISRVKSDRMWGSSKTTAVVVRALAAWVEKHESWDVQYTGKLFLNKNKIHEFPVSKNMFGLFPGILDIPRDSLKEKNRIVLGFDGSGQLFYSASMNYFLQPAPISEKGEEVTVSRTLRKLLYVEDSVGNWQLQLVPVGDSLKVGDELEVVLTVNSQSDYEYAVITDNQPAGFVYLRKDKEWHDHWTKDWKWNYSHFQEDGKRLVFYQKHLQKGESVYRYLIRAKTGGRFNVLPATVSLMYNPEIKGNSKSSLITVEDVD
jgi:uncharacterized protein YfaS (alpha-2-macroglobulin family)